MARGRCVCHILTHPETVKMIVVISEEQFQFLKKRGVLEVRLISKVRGSLYDHIIMNINRNIVVFKTKPMILPSPIPHTNGFP